MTQRSFQRANNKDHEQHGRPPQAAARQPSPARASLAAVTRRAGLVIGLTPPRLPTTVGESPFVQSVAGSSIQSPADGADGANGAVGVYLRQCQRRCHEYWGRNCAEYDLRF